MHFPQFFTLIALSALLSLPSSLYSASEVVICKHPSSAELAQKYYRAVEILQARGTSARVSEAHHKSCQTSTDSFLDKSFPGSKKSFRSLLSPIPLSLAFFGLSHKGQFHQSPPKFALSAAMMLGFSFLSTHSDYRIEEAARKITTKEKASHLYSLGNVAYWTVVPSIFLYPIYGSSSFGLSNLGFITNNLLIASINGLFNSFYEYEGLEDKADKWITSWYITMTALVPLYHASTMALIKGMTGPQAAKYKKIFVVFNATQLGIYFALQAAKSKWISKNLFLFADANEEQIADYFSRSVEEDRYFQRKLPDGSIVKVQAQH